MWENQENQTPAQPEVEIIKPTYEELESALAGAKSSMDIYRSRAIALQAKVDSVDEWITEEADALTRRQVEELCDILGLASTTIKTITLEVSIEVEVSADRNFDFGDISTWDFDIEVTQHSSEEWSIDSSDATVNSVDY
jgi:hypothetical protein